MLGMHRPASTRARTEHRAALRTARTVVFLGVWTELLNHLLRPANPGLGNLVKGEPVLRHLAGGLLLGESRTRRNRPAVLTASALRLISRCLHEPRTKLGGVDHFHGLRHGGTFFPSFALEEGAEG